MKRFKYNKKVDLFAKGCLIYSVLSLLVFCVISFLPVSVSVENFFLISFFISVVIVVIYLLFFEFTPENFDYKVKPDVFSTEYSCFDDFFDNAKKSLTDFELIEIYGKKYDDYEQHIYTHIYFENQVFTQKDFVIIVNADEMTEQLINKSFVDFTWSTESFYGRKLKNLAYNINIITVFCTKHISPELEKLLRTDAGILQSYSIANFFSVMSFDSKNLYLVNRKGWVGKTKYDNCRKKFLKYFSFLFPKETDK